MASVGLQRCYSGHVRLQGCFSVLKCAVPLTHLSESREYLVKNHNEEKSVDPIDSNFIVTQNTDLCRQVVVSYA